MDMLTWGNSSARSFLAAKVSVTTIKSAYPRALYILCPFALYTLYFIARSFPKKSMKTGNPPSKLSRYPS
jgi:hypothetical protein